ncbi:Bifunctional heparan sulfate N-deacetylase/N-sulfotransferase 2 [Geodia barretti]|uniref:[heparan sulfate]-glucosamine N-sulfotransferase n=1 Tax=Geodia barretti TaxID=519541 RepID=A0AA35RIR6_GEOBA|nr:Bifunctional heparan sulfate N-deacetylase/N-sulfotransferase 2 [Geodia barretti]
MCPRQATLAPPQLCSLMGLTSEKTTTKTNQERNSRVVKSREKSRHFSEKAQPPRVLLLYGTDGYRPSHEIKTFLESHRIPHRTTSLVKGQLLLGEKTNSSSYSQHLGEISILIIVSHFQASLVEPYLELCRARHLSLVWAVLPYPHSQTPKPHFSRLHASSVAPDAIVGMTLSPRYPFFYGRPGATGGGIPHGKNWTTFSLETSGDSHVTNPGSHVTNSGPLPVGDLNAANAWSNMGDGEPGTKNGTNGYRVLVEVRVKTGETDFTDVPVVLEDMGGRDGVRKIVMGAPVRFWLSHLMLLESVHQLSDGRLVREGRERMVMVDIDDIFLAPEGRRMRVDDVQAVLRAQAKLRQMVPGFTFNAGFVGGYYNSGALMEEKLGNQELVRNAEQLWWFDHTYKHHQPHSMSPRQLRTSMELNRQFAKDHGIPALVHHYAVSPHHSGVYPVHPPLYDSWRQIWNVSVTSTEEYPDLRPDHMRRGFKHRGISVLPRQTCRLFTHTFLYSHFPGGRNQLVSLAAGGEVFLTLLRTPVSIFMTHTPNYCCDRLALTLFPALFKFTSRWTQLQLSYPGPLAMADRYFSLYPEDTSPLWTSPCSNKRHREILPAWFNCSQLPQLLILGPQKSGTTALHTFLSLHPQVQTNRQSELHYEEVQFFSDDTLYQRGIQWSVSSHTLYISHTPSHTQLIHGNYSVQ